MSPEFRAGERETHISLKCTECGGKAEGNVSWTDGSGEVCDKCDAAMKAADEEANVSESETIPDFGPKADAAVKAACALFPTTFHLRAHEGTFRISERNSYVSRGVVLLYTQRLLSVDEYKSRYSKPAEPTEEDRWVDFAKGTTSELQSQIKR